MLVKAILCYFDTIEKKEEEYVWFIAIVPK